MFYPKNGLVDLDSSSLRTNLTVQTLSNSGNWQKCKMITGYILIIL